MRKWNAKHSERLKPHRAKLQRERAAKARVLIRELKKSIKEEKGCIDCGIRDWRVLDFDHRGDSPKCFNISDSILNIKKILLEIEKCDVRCANCHRIKTYERRIELS